MELTKTYLERLIADQIEESGILEYKAARSLGRNNDAKEEVTKDVSAFANARISNAELRGGLSMRIPIALTPIAHANAKG
jgi:hypothetical protein